jgi:hypothetical protein
MQRNNFAPSYSSSWSLSSASCGVGWQHAFFFHFIISYLKPFHLHYICTVNVSYIAISKHLKQQGAATVNVEMKMTCS